MFAIQSSVTTWVALAILLVTLFAFIDAILRPAETFTAADKLTKQGWLLILGIALAAELLFGFGIASFIGAIAGIVYIVDVRPAVAALSKRR